MVTTTTRIKKRSKVRLSGFDIIGIHTMEAPETSQTAENVARYFDNVQADAHWCVDNDSRVRVIEDQYIAWTLPGANSRSRNIELAGYARQTAEDWADAYSIAELEIGALCAAEWVIEGGIPVRRLTDEQIRNGEKGFAGHVDVNRVYKKSSHWDPGPCFPWVYFLDRVRVHVALLSGKPAPTAAAPQPTPSWDNCGYSTEYIKARQAQLNALGYTLEVDGRRGPATIAAVKDFQSKHQLDIDGIPGPKTAAALSAALTAAAKPATTSPSSALAVDGVRGPATISRWQQVMGTPVDGVISRPSTLIRADQGYLNGAVPVEHIRALTGAPSLAVDGHEGERTIKVRQFWLFNQHAVEVLGRGATAGDFDGIAGPTTTRLHQHALNAASPGAGRY